MTTIVSNIETSNWSMSTGGIGEVVQNATEINQTIGLILGTKKGTDPFRPTFGSDVWEYIDKPLTVAGPNIVRAITEAIDRWEPRINMLEISYIFQPQDDGSTTPAGLVFSITWQLIGGTDQEIVDLLISAGGNGDVTIQILSLETDNDFLITEDDNLIQL